MSCGMCGITGRSKTGELVRDRDEDLGVADFDGDWRLCALVILGGMMGSISVLLSDGMYMESDSSDGMDVLLDDKLDSLDEAP